MPNETTQKSDNTAYLFTPLGIDCTNCGESNLIEPKMAFNGEIQPFKCCKCRCWLILRFKIGVELYNV